MEWWQVIKNVTLLLFTGHPVRTKMNLISNILALDNNPFIFVVIRDLREKSKNWYPLDRTTYEGQYNWNHCTSFWPAPINSWSYAHLRKIIIMYRFGFYFSTQYGCKLRCSFFPSCKLPSPNFPKFDFKINYPSLYEREVWDCQVADVILIRRAIY